ncbi:hypothetical protein Q5P01_005452 [Channa striata]|uniref:Uncharacterized protein n=1 Tax=Channa striata TaxID=64152 RepID=A0AA88NGG5_CHASR|nr:hypothetical protein Q5P01_005452 [Channa striata]
MLKAWRIQRVHIIRGCLSDPEVEGGILYRYGGTLQLNHVQGEGAKVSVWIPIRGTSQQEGYHFHQAQWVTGTQVSSELFQAQGMTGVARTPATQSNPLRSSPTDARTGPVKTGGRVFVLDHKRWPAPMKKIIDDLLNKHHGQKDMLKLVDQDYSALYIKHLSKLMNTSSSLNTSPEKLQERQQLWHSLTEGSETTTVPVVTMPVAVVNPAPPSQLKKMFSPLIHTGFPGMVGKYIYCPSIVFSLYKDHGMEKEMTWKDFQKSPFYEMERQRWDVEKGK